MSTNAESQKRNEDDLICPISLNLPLEPAIAEDGRVYERVEIEKHISNNCSGELKSPITCERMGHRLVSSLPIRNLIETLIDNGAISGDIASTWKARFKEKKEGDWLLAKAAEGNAEAMVQVARRYRDGNFGFQKNNPLAFIWFEKAHATGCVVATASLAMILAKGVGVTKDEKRGIMYMTLAAARGSDYASYQLGLMLAEGLYGLSVNKEEAVHWLKLSVSDNHCTFQHMTELAKTFAHQKLEELLDDSEGELMDDSVFADAPH